LPEQVIDGSNGLVCREATADALANAVRMLIEDRGLLQTLSRGALEVLAQRSRTSLVDALSGRPAAP
jgi:glycosyltransferase involved in cell wall biosynthesis